MKSFQPLLAKTPDEDESFIPVFVDAKPAENLEPSTAETLCFVGLLSTTPTGVHKLKGYKNTKRQAKIDSAKRIIDQIQRKIIFVDAIGLASKTNGHFIQWACEVINKGRDLLNAEWLAEGNNPTHLLWDNRQIPRSTVLGLSVYASILPIIALRAAKITQHLGHRKLKFCLDTLPHQSDVGMRFMKEISQVPDLKHMWDENLQLGATFLIANMRSWLGADNKWHPAKKHPNLILVDWFAASCLANIEPAQLQREGDYNSSEIDVIADIWKSTAATNNVSLFDLEDPAFIHKVKEHAQIT